MQFIATSNFRLPTVAGVELKFKTPQRHPAHIDKGARFSINGDLPIEKLSTPEKNLIVELNRAGRIISPDQTELVQRVDAEVALQAQADAREKKRIEAARNAPQDDAIFQNEVTMQQMKLRGRI